MARRWADRPRSIGRLLRGLGIAGRAVELLQDLDDVAGAGRVEHPADGLGRDVVLPGERLDRSTLGVRVDDVGRLVLVTEPSHTIDVPGLLAEHLKAIETAEIRDALRGGRTIRRGQGYSVRVTAPLTLHRTMLKHCAALAGEGSAPAGRKAYRTYADRIAAVGNPRGDGSLDRRGH
ncbi:MULTISPECIES: hypothetical protein [Streptomyces]|uniref:hypothetical protein n=1 Tax=Streptomyces TaxID=1883 RepID=UPI00017E9D3D|nr:MULTISPECIES: hypothetical protein [Streptomyces]EDX20932.1 hypothetical protein SSAG_00723 [Streptomyces sp. Mg1]WSS03796.1 hypothetical protein OG224_37720 [Streptomyces goshikiensis]WSY02907.1 hypothetical protein OG590_37475 [Streptomyces goshikiensis]